MPDFKWTSETTWPVEGKEWTFLGRALGRFGRSQVVGWNGLELTYPWASYAPSRFDEAGTTTRAEAIHALRLLQPERSFSVEALDAESWAFYVEAKHRALKRRREAQERFRERCAFAVIGTAIRSVSQPGDFGPVKASFWNHEDLEIWFRDCRTSFNQAHGGSYLAGSARDQWIFVEKESLAAVIDTIDHEAEPTAQAYSRAKKWVEEAVAASPLRRPMTKDKMIKAMMAELGVSKDQAQKARDRVIEGLSGQSFKAWTQAGRQTKEIDSETAK